MQNIATRIPNVLFCLENQGTHKPWDEDTHRSINSEKLQRKTPTRIDAWPAELQLLL